MSSRRAFADLFFPASLCIFRRLSRPSADIWSNLEKTVRLRVTAPHRPASFGPSLRSGSLVGVWAAQTRRFYDDNADAYASATGNRDLRGSVEAFLSALAPAPRVIDLGSGSGRDLSAFREAGIDAVGLDVASELAALARRRSGAPVIVADMTRIPFVAGAFDGVWASASLLHLAPSDVSAALNETYRILRPGGVLFTSMKRGRGVRREQCGRWFSYVEPEAWRERLAKAGFKVFSSSLDEEVRQDGVVEWLTCLARRQ